jgi:nicotinamidase-related amidase
MSFINLDPERSILLLIDIQPSFMKIIHDQERVIERSLFLAQVARLFKVPVIASEQYPSRMGGTDSRISSFVDQVFPKMEFSAMANEAFASAVGASERKQAVVVGVETHICITQTCLDLLRAGFEVVACPDAVSSSSVDRHKLGMERLRDSGAMPAHSEAVAYEWAHTAESPQFKEMLQIVKNSKF